jgi:hypothetical protein
VRLPPGTRLTTAIVDGQARVVRTETVGEDAYAALTTTPGAHELKLQLAPAR